MAPGENLVFDGVVHGRVGMQNWHCNAVYRGRHFRVEWEHTDEPITCLRCLIPHMRGMLRMDDQ